MSTVVGFDAAAYKTGFAIGDLTTKTISKAGLFDARVEPATESLSEDELNMAVIQKVLRILKAYKPSKVFIEDTRISFANNTGHQDYYAKRVLAILEFYCKEKNIPYEFVPIARWKSKLFGKGHVKRFKAERINAKKEAVIVINQLYPHLDIRKDDAAEAVAIIHINF